MGKETNRRGVSRVSGNQQDRDRSGKFVDGNQAAQKSRFVADLIWRAHLQSEGKRARAMAENVWDLAEKGERWAVEFIRDTLDGKPKQQIEQSGPDGGPIAHSMTVELVKSESPAS